jgi:hypothetical protein
MTSERDSGEVLSSKLREQASRVALAQHGLVRVDDLYNTFDEATQSVIQEIETGVQIGERTKTDMF